MYDDDNEQEQCVPVTRLKAALQVVPLPRNLTSLSALHWLPSQLSLSGLTLLAAPTGSQDPVKRLYLPIT